jgi:hypothetical protein
MIELCGRRESHSTSDTAAVLVCLHVGDNTRQMLSAFGTVMLSSHIQSVKSLVLVC